MREYYIRIATYGTNTPHIIDEEIMHQAECGMINRNPDEFMFLCEGECLSDAMGQYWEEFSQMANDQQAERCHP